MRLEFKLKKKKERSFWKLKILGVIFVVLCLTGLYYSPVGQKGIELSKTAWHFCSDKAYWKLNQVVVEGHKRSDTKALVEALNVIQGQDMNTISLQEARGRLLQLPWVKEAVVERHLPNKLIVHITEKTPIALWQNNQNYYPLDEEGHPINDNKLLPADLILVVGVDAPENTLALLMALEKVPHINQLVRSAVRIEKRRWNLHLMDAEEGMEILLPETEVEHALLRLENQDQKERLLKKDIQAIDMRLSDRIILHPKKSSNQKTKKRKK